MAQAHPTVTFNRNDDWPIEGAAHWHDWSPIDLTDAEFEWMLRKPPAQDGTLGEIVLQKATADVTIIDAKAGTFRFMVENTESDLPAGDYYDQLRVTTSAGRRTTQWYGAIRVRETYFPPPAP